MRGTEAPGVFAVPWCTGAIMSFNKHKCDKKIMQKIDKKLCIVYVGERSNFKIFLRTRKIMVMHSNERG